MAPAKPRQLNPFDPQALIEAQRRNLEAFTNAGEIVVDGMRTYAERQVGMMQETMSGLLGNLQAGAAGPKAAAPPAAQMERMRAAFEKMVGQVQELSQLLIKVQSEALSVLNACAMRNLETLGAAAPDLSDLQMRAEAAFETASRETTAVVDEMKKRMASIETGGHAIPAPVPAAAAATPATPPKPAPPRTVATSKKPAAAKPATRRPPRATGSKPARTTRGPAKPPS